MAGSHGCGVRHALGFAADLWRMCVVNEQPARDAARSLGLELEQTEGAVRLLRKCGRMPSPERLAVTVMLDPGMEDDDIASIFGRSVRWASVVRSLRDEIRQEDPIDHALEFLDEHLRPDMPSPQEIQQRALACRKPPQMPRIRGPQPDNLRRYQWTGGRFAQFQDRT